MYFSYFLLSLSDVVSQLHFLLELRKSNRLIRCTWKIALALKKQTHKVNTTSQLFSGCYLIVIHWQQVTENELHFVLVKHFCFHRKGACFLVFVLLLCSLIHDLRDPALHLYCGVLHRMIYFLSWWHPLAPMRIFSERRSQNMIIFVKKYPRTLRHKNNCCCRFRSDIKFKFLGFPFLLLFSFWCWSICLKL